MSRTVRVETVVRVDPPDGEDRPGRPVKIEPPPDWRELVTELFIRLGQTLLLVAALGLAGYALWWAFWLAVGR